MNTKIFKCCGIIMKAGFILLFFASSFSILAGGDNTELLPPASVFYPTANTDYYLNDVGTATKGSDENGCHGQAIKFDGQYFYTTCVDTNGQSSSYLYVHNNRGELIKSYTEGSYSNHPSGILLYKGWAYTGFTHSGFFTFDSELRRFNSQGIVESQGFFDHSVGFVGGHFSDINDPELNLEPTYYSYTQYYQRRCQGIEGDCDYYEDLRKQVPFGSPILGVQDCDNYYKNGAWYKACILFTADKNKIRIWSADTMTLLPSNALDTLVMTDQPGHSGGMGFYTDPSGTKWIVTAPPPSAECSRRSCRGCTLVGNNVCACTDKQNRQRVRFARFDSLAWPE